MAAWEEEGTAEVAADPRWTCPPLRRRRGHRTAEELSVSAEEAALSPRAATTRNSSSSLKGTD